MKKLFFGIVFCASLGAYAQNAGVNTTAPTSSLDINGTLRVRELPAAGAGFNYNGTATTYTPTRMLQVDANGVLGAVQKSFLAFNFTSLPATTYTTTITTGTATENTLSAQTITLDAPALVTINASVPYNNVQTSTGAAISDGIARILRAQIVVNGTRLAAQTNVISNNSATNAPTGVYYNNISAVISLPAGTHTINLTSTHFYNVRVSVGGSSGTLFQAKVEYL